MAVRALELSIHHVTIKPRQPEAASLEPKGLLTAVEQLEVAHHQAVQGQGQRAVLSAKANVVHSRAGELPPVCAHELAAVVVVVVAAMVAAEQWAGRLAACLQQEHGCVVLVVGSQTDLLLQLR